MKYLFGDWKKIESVIRKSPHILLLADYDGTLTPIASRPQAARLNKTVRRLLKVLAAKKKRFFVGIISGRRLRDVRRWTGLGNIYYAGNHGLEIEGPEISFLHPSCKRDKKSLLRLKRGLLSKTRSVKGAIVEYKGASLSLHYRLVRKTDLKRLKAILNTICAPYVKKGIIRIFSGKKVWELRLPVRWHKGAAVKKILEFLRERNKDLFPIYLGDDTTDEDAFSFLRRRRSLTVFVGRRHSKTKAEYYLKSPQEVKRLLAILCRI